MGVCGYCNKKIRRASATICKPCLDEVFRYEQSIKWFEHTDMDKFDYFNEIIKMTGTTVIQKHFQLESRGLSEQLRLHDDETLLAVIKNVKYDKDLILDGDEKRYFRKNEDQQGWHVKKVRREMGFLFITTKRLELIGRDMKVVKRYREEECLEDYDGLGISIPAYKQVRGREVTLRQYFYPFVDYKYLVNKAFEFENNLE